MKTALIALLCALAAAFAMRAVDRAQMSNPTVALGTECGPNADETRVYSDPREAGRACQVVDLHDVDGVRPGL